MSERTTFEGPKVLFRVINELICEQADGYGHAGDRHELICECARPDCVATASVTVSEFDAIRNSENLVLVGPDHSVTARDRLVRSTSRFGVVETH